MFLFRDIEFVQRVDQVLRDDGELARLDAESAVGRGRRSTDDLAGPAKKQKTPVVGPLNFSKLATIEDKFSFLTLARGFACMPKSNTVV